MRIKLLTTQKDTHDTGYTKRFRKPAKSAW